MFNYMLVVHKPIWFSAQSTIMCPGVNAFVWFIYISICCCLLDVSCPFPVICHIIYHMFMCIAILCVIFIVYLCFLPLSIVRIILHIFYEEFFTLFQYFVKRVLCMQGELLPEVLFGCDGIALMCLLLFLLIMWPVFVSLIA